MDGVDWDIVKNGCPRCGRQISWHTLTGWCHYCGWGVNWEDWDPLPKKTTES